MTKENDGKAARKRAVKKLLVVAVTVLVLTVSLLCLFVQVDNNNYNNNNGQQQQRFGIAMMNGQMPRRLGHQQHSHQQRRHRHHQGDGGGGDVPEALDETGMDPHEVAVRFRQDLYNQFDTKDEIALLEDVLEARIHLVEIVGIEEEVLRAPQHSYNGVYGRFCRLNFDVHKENPSSGTYILQKKQDCNKTQQQQQQQQLSCCWS
jgi:hypothetical protein